MPQINSNVSYTPDSNQQEQDIKALDLGLQQPVTTTPIDGSETASLSSTASKKAIGIYRSLFAKHHSPQDIKPPKKYLDNKLKEASDAIADVPNPEGLVGRSADEFNTNDSFQLNFDQLENEDDVNGMMAEVADRFKDQITEARGGIRRDVEIQGLADDLGTDASFVAEFVNSKDSQFVAPEKILAARKVLNQSAIKLKKLADMVTSNEATDVDKLTFKKQYAFHQQFMTQFMAKRANIGRSLRAYGMPTGTGDAQTDAIEGMLMNIHGGLNYKDAAKQLSASPNIKGVNLMVQAQDNLFKKAGNVFIEVFVNSILSGVKTHIINTTGSAMMIASRTMDSYVAAKFGNPMGNLEDKMIIDEWKAGLFGLTNGFGDAFGTMTQVMKTAEPYGGVSKLENQGRQFVTGEYIGLKGTAGTAVDILGEIVRAPTERLMGGIDGFMKVLAERQALAQVAYRKANNEAIAQDLNPKEALELLNYYVQHPTDSMKEEAVNASLHVTFQTPLGSTGQLAQKLASANPVITYFMPFVKTPINLMKQGFLERTPLALLTKEFKADMAAGGARAQMAQARVYTGTAIALAGTVAAVNGTITGAGPDNWKLKQAMVATGWRPYSIKVENDDGSITYVSYQRTEPYSYIFGTIADFTEVMKIRAAMRLGEDDQAYTERITGSLITALSHATLDRSFLTGVQSAMDILNAPSGGKINTFTKSLINAEAGYSGLRRDITRVFDDAKYTSDNSLEELKKNTPYYNKSLPKMLNGYGETMSYDAIMNPFAVVSTKQPKWKQEVLRLINSTQKTPIGRPSKVYNGIRMSGEDYHDWVLVSRKKLTVDGMNFEQTVKEAMNSDVYATLIDEKKVDMISAIKSSFDTAALYNLAQKSEGFRERLIAKKTAESAKQKAALEGGTEDSYKAEMKLEWLDAITDQEFEIASPQDENLFYNKGE